MSDNPFLLFRSYHARTLRGRGLTNGQVSKVTGKWWKEEGEEGRKVWAEKAKIGLVAKQKAKQQIANANKAARAANAVKQAKAKAKATTASTSSTTYNITKNATITNSGNSATSSREKITKRHNSRDITPRQPSRINNNHTGKQPRTSYLDSYYPSSDRFEHTESTDFEDQGSEIQFESDIEDEGQVSYSTNGLYSNNRTTSQMRLDAMMNSHSNSSYGLGFLREPKQDIICLPTFEDFLEPQNYESPYNLISDHVRQQQPDVISLSSDLTNISSTMSAPSTIDLFPERRSSSDGFMQLACFDSDFVYNGPGSGPIKYDLMTSPASE